MPVSPTKIHSSFFPAFFFICMLIYGSSCTVVKQYQPNKPFVFENEIVVEGKTASKALREKLATQVEDSVKPVFKNVLFVRRVMRNPAAFDSNYVKKTIQNMDNLLENSGFYRGSTTADWTSIDTLKDKPDQHRMKVVYHVKPGRVFRNDSIRYVFKDSALQKLVDSSLSKSYLKKNEPYSKQSIDDELNRLMDVFRDNGYYKITREMVKAQLDTVDISLINPLADPFELIQLQLEAQKKRENPTINIAIIQIPVKDSTLVEPYTIGKVTIFPDEPVELALNRRGNFTRTDYNGYHFVSRFNLFKPSFIAKRLALKPGDVYRVTDYNRTLINFNRIEAWQNVNITGRARDTSNTVDFFIRMVPAKKYFFGVDFEGSSILTAQYQLFNTGNKGLALSFNFKNRNVAKQALQLENVLRTGIEFTDFSKILSSEIGLSNRLVFPRLLTPFFKVKDEHRFLNAKTYVSLDGSYIDRYRYYKINTINAYLGYEFQRKASTNWQVRFPNIEYTRIYDKDLGFISLISDYPLLEYSYNDGLIMGINATYTRRFTYSNPRSFGLLKVYGEESGLLTGALLKSQTAPGKPLQQLYRFVKFSADFRHYFARPKTAWAFRFFGGYGLGFETESQKGTVSLPFFRQFFAGGPNSMRGWRLRKLGPGSSIVYDTLRYRTPTSDPNVFIEKRFDDRYADIQLEANIEYRFDIFPVYGYWLRGALFTDIGNVWIRKDSSAAFQYGVMKANRLYTDIAVAGGGGLRLDFKFFLLRFDLAWRLKDPLYASDAYLDAKNDGWFIKKNMSTPSFQFGIGYPF